MTIKAIETRYAGCAFRSRLEARWAVFFDELGIEWEYEPQGFESVEPVFDADGIPIGEHRTGYLPDFYLPNVKSWSSDRNWSDTGIYVEVKGADAMASPKKLLTMMGLIDYHGPLHQGLLLLGPVPDVRGVAEVSHLLLAWHKGIDPHWVSFEGNDLRRSTLSVYCPLVRPSWAEEIPEGLTFEPQLHAVRDVNSNGSFMLMPRAKAAYEAARSARFEHGHSGAVR